MQHAPPRQTKGNDHVLENDDEEGPREEVRQGSEVFWKVEWDEEGRGAETRREDERTRRGGESAAARSSTTPPWHIDGSDDRRLAVQGPKAAASLEERDEPPQSYRGPAVGTVTEDSWAVTAGAPLTFRDGLVGFLSYSLDRNTLTALGSRKGSKVVVGL